MDVRLSPSNSFRGQLRSRLALSKLCALSRGTGNSRDASHPRQPVLTQEHSRRFSGVHLINRMAALDPDVVRANLTARRDVVVGTPVAEHQQHGRLFHSDARSGHERLVVPLQLLAPAPRAATLDTRLAMSDVDRDNGQLVACAYPRGTDDALSGLRASHCVAEVLPHGHVLAHAARDGNVRPLHRDPRCSKVGVDAVHCAWADVGLQHVNLGQGVPHVLRDVVVVLGGLEEPEGEVVQLAAGSTSDKDVGIDRHEFLERELRPKGHVGTIMRAGPERPRVA
mmetsp:Transcript_32240/g.82057  ORF Transcript_32240/g.82057 Transcript_32240/m.82057 type:complete len:282 (+) Transcript_32240:17-862(+)